MSAGGLAPALRPYRHLWPREDLGASGWRQAAGGTWERALPESREALAADSRWPALFPSPVCLVTAAHGRTVVLERVVGPSIVVSSFQLAELIIVESSLSFLGLGVQPPTPSWGGMVSEGRDYVGSAWWISALPGLAIVVTVLGANLFGDALRRSLDPRLRGVS